MAKEKGLYYLDNKYFDEYVENEIKSRKHNKLNEIEYIDDSASCLIEGNIWDNLIDDSGLPF